MRGAGILVALASVVGCSGDVSSQPMYPDIVFPDLTVTEGGSTQFLLTFDAAPTSNLACYFDAQLKDVALVMPAYFHASPTNYPVMLTAYGVDDMKPSGNRNTNFDGRIVDNGTYSGGSVEVIDKDSPNIVASNWNVFLSPSGTATFDVRLTQPPSSSTTVMLVAGKYNTSAVLLGFDPTSLIFGPTDYDVPRTVTVTSTGQSGLSSILLRPSDVTMTANTVLVTVTH